MFSKRKKKEAFLELMIKGHSLVCHDITHLLSSRICQAILYPLCQSGPFRQLSSKNHNKKTTTTKKTTTKGSPTSKPPAKIDHHDNIDTPKGPPATKGQESPTTTMSAIPATPVKQKPEGDQSIFQTPTGSWRHPALDKIARQRREDTFNDASARRIVINIVALIASFVLLNHVKE